MTVLGRYRYRGWRFPPDYGQSGYHLILVKLLLPPSVNWLRKDSWVCSSDYSWYLFRPTTKQNRCQMRNVQNMELSGQLHPSVRRLVRGFCAFAGGYGPLHLASIPEVLSALRVERRRNEQAMSQKSLGPPASTWVSLKAASSLGSLFKNCHYRRSATSLSIGIGILMAANRSI